MMASIDVALVHFSVSLGRRSGSGRQAGGSHLYVSEPQLRQRFPQLRCERRAIDLEYAHGRSVCVPTMVILHCRQNMLTPICARTARLGLERRYTALEVSLGRGTPDRLGDCTIGWRVYHPRVNASGHDAKPLAEVRVDNHADGVIGVNHGNS